MTKSELIKNLTDKLPDLPCKLIEDAVKETFVYMASSLKNGERIEVRGFGSFESRYRKPRIARNPKTGDKVEMQGRYTVHFKPGKELKDRVNVEGITQNEN